MLTNNKKCKGKTQQEQMTVDTKSKCCCCWLQYNQHISIPGQQLLPIPWRVPTVNVRNADLLPVDDNNIVMLCNKNKEITKKTFDYLLQTCMVVQGQPKFIIVTPSCYLDSKIRNDLKTYKSTQKRRATARLIQDLANMVCWRNMTITCSC